MLLVLVPERNMNDGSQRPSGFKSCASLETWSMNRIEKEYWPNKKVTKPASKAKVCQKRAERCFPCGSTKISRWMAEGWVIFLGGWGMVVSCSFWLATGSLGRLGRLGRRGPFGLFHYVSLCFTMFHCLGATGHLRENRHRWTALHHHRHEPSWDWSLPTCWPRIGDLWHPTSDNTR